MFRRGLSRDQPPLRLLLICNWLTRKAISKSVVQSVHVARLCCRHTHLVVSPRDSKDVPGDGPAGMPHHIVECVQHLQEG